jgi:hypothetical protein
MAKARRAPKEAVGGPYLDAALICERVLQDKDGAYSAIRLVNRITFFDLAVESGALISLPLAGMVSFKAGDVQGGRELFLYLTNPSGRREPLPGVKHPTRLEFQGGDTGVVMPFPIQLNYEGDGTYWIDVELDGKVRSRMPLTFVTKKEAPPLPPSEKPPSR